MTTIVFGLKICLQRFSIERHLEIIYKNRVAVLRQFGLFEAQISSTNEADKNTLRLAIANMIFNDPKTGLIATAKDISVNPSVNIAENLLKK